jgi:septal ring factor EnvC (AmiA/AmiB activator)
VVSEGFPAGDGGIWCAYCPSHVENAAELAVHMIGAHGSTAPPYSSSTSARLRQVQAALAASQQDLTRVERERDGVREELARQAAECEDLRATLAMRTGQLTYARTELEQLRAYQNWIDERSHP